MEIRILRARGAAVCVGGVAVTGGPHGGLSPVPPGSVSANLHIRLFPFPELGSPALVSLQCRFRTPFGLPRHRPHLMPRAVPRTTLPLVPTSRK